MYDYTHSLIPSGLSLSCPRAQGKSFVLYPGGIAELFLSSPTEEVRHQEINFHVLHL